MLHQIIYTTYNNNIKKHKQFIAASVQIGQIVADIEFIDLDYGTNDGCFR